MTSIIEEAKLLPSSLIADFSTLSLEDDSNATEIIDIINNIRDNNIGVPLSYTKLLNEEYKNTLRVITCVEDKEGKDRVIAILDYWSQLFLKPFHQSLMGLLENNF
jgi:hypothetical protein